MMWPDLTLRMPKTVAALPSPKSLADLFGLAPARIKVTFRDHRIECDTVAECQTIIRTIMENPQ